MAAEAELAAADEVATQPWARAWLALGAAKRKKDWGEIVRSTDTLLSHLDFKSEPYLGACVEALLVRGLARLMNKQYLDALEAYCALTTTHIGRFQHKHHRCHACQQKWTSYEEKESDVSLGVQLVEDTALGMMDEAWIVSGDSDMAPAVRSARRIAAQQGRALRLVAVFPPRRSSHTLSQLADHTLRIFDRVPENDFCLSATRIEVRASDSCLKCS